MRQNKTILLSGKMGSGKSAVASIILPLLAHRPTPTTVAHLTFSTPLYSMHDYILTLLSLNSTSPNSSPNSPSPNSPSPNSPLSSFKPSKNGELLQYLGDFSRNIKGPNVLVDIAKRYEESFHKLPISLNQSSYLLISDLRLKTELEAFPEAYLVRLECDRNIRKSRCESWRENEEHITEVDLDDCLDLFDLVINTEKETPREIATRIVWGVLNGDRT